MKTRHSLTIVLAALLLYVLGPGCLQDFGAFQPCGFGEKLCGSSCVAVLDAEFGCGGEGCAPCDLANASATCNKTDCAIQACIGTFQNCDGAPENGCEADLSADPGNCGMCGQACVAPHGQPSCETGNCGIGTCDPGWDDCNDDAADGCEANLDTDPENCGTCGTSCPGFESCQAGKCVLVCDPGKGDCDNNPDNGCETDFGTTLNCGFCGDTCDLANAAAACDAGQCVVENCANGFGDCDNMAANGCEADLQNSAATCGTCDNACPMGANGTTVCDAGSCAFNCNAGFGDCDGMLANGCETDTNATEAHCGGCGQDCTIANGTGSCNNGTCELDSCTPPFEDCNNNPMDGCEVNTDTSPVHCGSCATVCGFPNAQSACNGGMCAIGMCNAGFGNCNNMTGDGCEVSTATSATNCGTCGNVCPGGANATASCTNSMCGLTCDAGFGNCNNMAADGCEADTATSITNCGACGRACSGQNVASRSCTAGVCDSTCNLGFANCSMPASGNDNGCELNVANNDDNCGGCGNSCTLQVAMNDLECDLNVPGVQNFCGCSSNQECDKGGGGTCITSMIDPNLGHCQCGAATCAAGESCANAGNACSCNGGAACGAGETCCQTPGGCFNLDTDPQNCGGCGHECPAGFVCTDPGVLNAPECRCDGADDCDAGTGGTFTCNGSGRCVCGANTCAVGQRCLPNGQCG